MKSRVDSPSEGLELLRSLFYTNYTDRAVDVAEHLERLNLTPEQNWERLEYLGFLHYRRGQYGKARSCAQELLTATSGRYYEGRAHFILGLCYLEEWRVAPSETKFQQTMMEFDAALARLESAEAVLPVITAKSVLIAESGRQEEAVALLQESVKPYTVESAELGWTYARIGEFLALDFGDYERAIAYLQAATRMLDGKSTVHSWVCSLLAQCYNHSMNYQQALAPAERAVELAQLDPEVQRFAVIRAHLELGIALTYTSEDLSCAEAEIRKALGLAHGNPSKEALAYYALGAIQNRQGRSKQALASYEHALKLNYDGVATQSLFVNAGVAAFDAHRYKETIHYMQRSLEFDGALLEGKICAYYCLGESYRQQKQYRQAAENFRLGLQLTGADHRYYGLLMQGLVSANNQQ